MSSPNFAVLSDGRRLAYSEYGAADGWPVLALHGTPGSRLKYAPADPVARALGLRLISVDRWGYGGSPPHPAPSLGAFGADCGALLDHIGAEKAGVVGISGGGPFAVAAGCVLGPRITRLALVAPVGQIAGAKLGWRALNPLHAFAFRVLPWIPSGVRGVFAPFRQIAFAAPASSVTVATLRAARADRRLMRHRTLRQSLGACFAEGLRRDARGPEIDLRIFGRRWDVELDRLTCASKVWIGSADRNVPIPAAVALARRLSHCTLDVMPDAGHFWIAQNFDVVLRWLAERDAGNLPRGRTAHEVTEPFLGE